MTAPLQVGFDTKVNLTIHRALLAAAGPLQCDPIAHISVVTLRRQRATSESAGSCGQSAARSPVVASCERRLASTEQRVFTAHPDFSQTLSVVVPFNPCSGTGALARAIRLLADGGKRKEVSHRNPSATDDGSLSPFQSLSAAIQEELEAEDESFLVVTVEDSAGSVFGQAQCPSSLNAPSTVGRVATERVRLMLMPRNHWNQQDSQFQEDLARLRRLGLDDFGYVDVSWDVALLPHGGAMIPASAPPQAGAMATEADAPPPFPIGVALRATWLAPKALCHRGATFSTAVDFGGADRFVFDGTEPLFLTIQSAASLSTVNFHCVLQQGQHGHSDDLVIPVPLQPLTKNAMERDVWWTSAVVTHDETPYGVLLSSVRLISKPLEGKTPMCESAACPLINDPTHQAEFSHVVRDWGRPPPDTPRGSYRSIAWESDAHVARATERRWKRDCIVGARPSVEHVRHLLDALAGRVALDPNVAQLVSVFFNTPATAVSPGEMKQLIIASAFHASGMTAQEAARFGFVLMRSDSEKAITLDDVVFILEHSLVGKTVDMPVGEVRRRVVSLFGVAPYVHFDDYQRCFMRNYAMWYDFGIPLQTVSPPAASTATAPNGGAALVADDCDAAGAVMDRHELVPVGIGMTQVFTVTTATRVLPQRQAAAHASGSGTREEVAAASGESSAKGPGEVDGAQWRTFTVRSAKTGVSLSVTSHAKDTVADVMALVEKSLGIRPARQEWTLHGMVLEPDAPVCRAIAVVEKHVARTGKSAQGGPASVASHGGAAGTAPGAVEILVHEREEMIAVLMVWPAKNRRWECRVAASDKVLKLRALVQQKTMIPLSRCVLTYGDKVLADRHRVSYYNLSDGAAITVSQD